MRTAARRSGAAGDRGVTIVEAAFALPILLMFVFGLIDLGLWTLNANQATNAARDGARAAILAHAGADVPGSDAEARIHEAVAQHLDGRDVRSISITCVDPSDAPLPSCATADLDQDRVRVQVEWGWTMVSPVATILGVDEGRARGSAAMAIVGRPLPGTATTSSTTTTTIITDPGTCTLASSDVAPAVVETTGPGTSQLASAVDVTFRTNGSATCGDLRIVLYSSHQAKAVEEVDCGCGEGPDLLWSYVGSDNAWKPGTGTVEIYSGTALLETHTFSVVEGAK